MAIEQQVSLGPNPNPVDGETNGVDARPPPSSTADGGDDSNKAPRLPRWTRQDILVLIQGKRDAESRYRRGRVAGLAFGSGQIEPKWSSVSSYCKNHGVNRESVQCRKRWSNLAGDYKKIKEWESQIKDETESYWFLRNDLRRERKLPGFFDKEVYDILDSGSQTPALAPATVTTETVNKGKDDGGGVAAAEEAEVDTEQQHLYDSNRSAAVEDGLFSDFEQEEVYASSEKEVAPTMAIPAPTNISEKQYQTLLGGHQGEGNAQGCTDEKQPGSNPEVGSTSQGGRKRKRFARDGEEEILQCQLIDVMEKNGKMLNSQLESQNLNLWLDREQRKDQTSNLVAVLDKLADALARIADKL